MPSVCRRRTPQSNININKGYYIAVMTNCLALMVGILTRWRTNHLVTLVIALPTDKKGTGCSLTASITMGYITESLAVWAVMNGERDHNGAGGKTKLRLGATD